MSINNFPAFAKLVAISFQELCKGEVFVVNIDGDLLFNTYLEAFPPGTNPLYKTKTEHDCSCCRHFIRRVGGVVAISKATGIATIWDRAAKSAPAPYKEVAAHLREVVVNAEILDLFRVGGRECEFGAEQTRNLRADSKVMTWDHFFSGKVPNRLRVAACGEVVGSYRTTTQVFERGLTELTANAVETVLSLIKDNNLYRGEEHKSAIVQFQKMQREFLALPDDHSRNLFVWQNSGSPVARFRNTVIGTLVQDLSEGQDVDRAVGSFEAKVAPANYKRTKAVITPMMITKAMETLQALDLESALERRFAVIGDVSVRDVLWVDGSARPLMKGGIADVLMQHAVSNRRPVQDLNAEPIGLDEFVSRVLPTATSMDLLFDQGIIGNLMSLTAPCQPEPKQLFRWTNDFAWSYSNNVADSIKERVKAAGGKVDGVTLRVSLSWFNYDDLDLHVYDPLGTHIYYANKRGAAGGCLDVDMNAGSGKTRTPVENVQWTGQLLNGTYAVRVHNFQSRESSNPGFVVEIESGGQTTQYSYSKPVENNRYVQVMEIHVADRAVKSVDVVDADISKSGLAQEKWGLKTGEYAKVSAVMLSPNYWGDNCVGNKHTFFILEKAKNSEPTRGFYNEFLHPRLEPHRKVFEVIADKTQCQTSDNQLSGLGFSSTKKDTFTIRVWQGQRPRLFRVTVGVKAVSEPAIQQAQANV